MRKGQSALEYLLVVGFAVAMVSIGLTAYLMKASEKAREGDMQKIETMAREILATAKDVYYAGSYSRKNLRYIMPNSLQMISVNGLELVFTVSTSAGESELLYISDVPLEGFNLPTNAALTQQIVHIIVETSPNAVVVATMPGAVRICTEEFGCS